MWKFVSIVVCLGALAAGPTFQVRPLVYLTHVGSMSTQTLSHAWKRFVNETSLQVSFGMRLVNTLLGSCGRSSSLPNLGPHTIAL